MASGSRAPTCGSWLDPPRDVPPCLSAASHAPAGAGGSSSSAGGRDCSWLLVYWPEGDLAHPDAEQVGQALPVGGSGQSLPALPPGDVAPVPPQPARPGPSATSHAPAATGGSFASAGHRG